MLVSEAKDKVQVFARNQKKKGNDVMIDVEVLIDNFKDLKVYNQKTTIIRNGKEMTIQFKLLQKGDIYKIEKSRYKALSEKGYVTKVIKKQDSKEE